MNIQWSDINSVNVKEIDEQHKKAVEIINRVLAIKKGAKTTSIEEILQELKDYANYHFSTEEKYFNLYDYPEKEAHIKQHQYYREEIKKLEEKAQKDLAGGTDEILNFLRDWWLSHINNSDTKYADFFNQHGLF